MNAGTYISGLGHGAVILFALVGGIFLPADDPFPLQVSEVSLISSEEFAAMILPDEAPDVAVEEPSIPVPTPEDEAPEVALSSDAAPVLPQPADVRQPAPETVLTQPQFDPAPVAGIVGDTPELTTPAIEDSSAPVAAEPDDIPKPAPAPRIAPESAPEPAPDSEIAEQVTPEVAPEQADDSRAEIIPPKAPQEAASEIVTEAETPASAAPAASPRPRARPSRPAVSQPRPPSDPTAQAVAAAVATPVRPTPISPTGPPLSQGERDSLRFAVRQCWVVDVGSIAANITVTIGFSLDKAGKVVRDSLSMLGFDGGEGPPVKTAFEAARRAILRCQKGGYKLPSEKYSRWQDIEITFNPENMRIK